MKIWLTLFTLLIAGCSNTPIQQDSLFLLPVNHSVAIASKSAPIVVIKTNLAEYLDQVGLVYRLSDTEVVLAKHNRWAQKISTQINQQMIINLRAKQSTYWPIQLNAAMILNDQPQLHLSLSKFNGVYTGDAELSGEWLLIDSQGNIIQSDNFEIIKPLKSEGYEQLVIALAEGLDELASLIAQQIN